SPKTDVAIELDGGGVLGGHLEVRPAHARLQEPGQGAADEGLAQPHPSKGRDYADILDRPDLTVVQYPLDGTDVPLGARNQPGGPGKEPGLAPDLVHQPAATVSIAQAGKHIGIDFTHETPVLNFGVLLQQSLLPRDPGIPLRQYGGRDRTVQVDLHAEPL